MQEARLTAVPVHWQQNLIQQKRCKYGIFWHLWILSSPQISCTVCIFLCEFVILRRLQNINLKVPMIHMYTSNQKSTRCVGEGTKKQVKAQETRRRVVLHLCTHIRHPEGIFLKSIYQISRKFLWAIDRLHSTHQHYCCNFPDWSIWPHIPSNRIHISPCCTGRRTRIADSTPHTHMANSREGTHKTKVPCLTYLELFNWPIPSYFNRVL